MNIAGTVEEVHLAISFKHSSDQFTRLEASAIRSPVLDFGDPKERSDPLSADAAQQDGIVPLAVHGVRSDFGMRLQIS